MIWIILYFVMIPIFYAAILRFTDLVVENGDCSSYLFLLFTICLLWPATITIGFFPFLGWLYLKYVKK